MASHGIPRVSEADPDADQTRQKQQQKIKDYRELVARVQEATKTDHSFAALQLTSKLLSQNPEYYTIWNERRRILGQHFDQLLSPESDRELDSDKSSPHAQTEISDLLNNDLAFIFPLLVKFPKCYWIWNHRLWLLQQASQRLPTAQAREFWTNELGLATKMLAKDSRNFHGWGYRRMVVAELESDRLQPQDEAFKDKTGSMVKPEFDYTTRMINTNLSNFSAWHNRSKLIPRLLEEQAADESTRRKLLDDGQLFIPLNGIRLTAIELQLILEALYTDPYDQSLWFYHTYLTTTFSSSPQMKQFSIVPSLTTAAKAEYLVTEIDKLKEMLPEADDCKWIYQRLLELCLDYRELQKDWPSNVESSNLQKWVADLMRLDPLRAGRWRELTKRLQVTLSNELHES